MTKSTVHIIWVGEPRFSKGGQDVIAAETIDQNFKKFYPDTPPNKLIFFCLGVYQNQYKQYFAERNVNIRVKSIEQYLITSLETDKSVEQILQIYHKILSPERNRIIDRVNMKVLFMYFLLAKKGGYALDSNIGATLDSPVHFKEYDEYHYPKVGDTTEIWMLYSPPHDRIRAKEVLAIYLGEYKRAEQLFEKDSYTEQYHKLLGYTGVYSVRSAPSLSRVWQCGEMETCIVKIPDLNLVKEYYNSHAYQTSNTFLSPHLHAMKHWTEKLKFDLDHGISPQLKCSPFVENNESNYQLTDVDLLQTALFYLKSPSEPKLETIHLLLEAGADVNSISTMTYPSTGTPHEQNALIIAIKKNSLAMIHALFEYTKIPIKLNCVLNNMTPLMYAVKYNCGVVTLLEHGACPNQSWPDQKETPLILAITAKNTNLVDILLKCGKKANPNQPIYLEDRCIKRYPLHIALHLKLHDIVKILIDHGAGLQVESQILVENHLKKIRTQDIPTSLECSDVLEEAYQKQSSTPATSPAYTRKRKFFAAVEDNKQTDQVKSAELNGPTTRATR